LRSHTALTGIASTLHQSAPASESDISSSSATIVLRVSQSGLRALAKRWPPRRLTGIENRAASRTSTGAVLRAGLGLERRGS
jgi:hypothetical protein